MSYQRLADLHRRKYLLSHVQGIVSWDEAVMMPSGSGEERGRALALLAEMEHELGVAPEMAEALAAAEDQEREQLDDHQRANLNEMRRAYTRATALPVDLVRAMSLASTRCEQAWRSMRAEGDWSGFAPLLSEVVARRREAAQAWSEALGLSPYDCLIDEFEPGIRSADIDVWFAEIRAFLPDLLQTALSRNQGGRALPEGLRYPIDGQRALGVAVIREMGFNFELGRVDVSHHPFCGGGPRDVRITTRYDEQDFLSSLWGLIHEAGHGKYEQGLPEAWLDQPAGRARSMAVHESQSLFHEMQIARSPGFCRWLAPRVAQAFGDGPHDPRFAASELERWVTQLRPGKIRVDADEVCYPAHILLRYDIERQLIAGAIEVGDIPGLWRAGMLELLGIDIGDDMRDGCMQDVHWPSGAFGYFPSYTLGAMIAAQLAEAMRSAITDLDAQIERGSFDPMDAWLADKVWRHGSLLSTAELIREATGSELGVAAYRRHLELRYLGQSSV